ncbi:TraR/DksA C4-type zinc finger protein [Salmonella enterica]|nr:conjugal transfer protein TraR [Salmonella enterica subsp. enterica serovar Javiana]EFS5057058.1 conjugal transfer protein TraR [Salmonella enterica]EIK2562343.1 TraR/DksA C4-type zinc finger protein [Salmonella enterica]EKB5322767.1 TraR/DksA C4-type zinc finger protein [Salmonella enterica]EKO2289571.1 TraR/DksA C4-type zinc finger protein [Salmonella enterica]
MSDEADEAFSVTEQRTGILVSQIRQKINNNSLPVYFCELCGSRIPDKRREIFPGITLCVYCQDRKEKRDKHYAYK